MIWNTLKRLQKLERESAKYLGRIASLLDEKNLSAWVSRLQSEREIDSLLKEAEDA